MARLLHQSRQAELPVGSGEWLLAVIGAVAAEPPECPPLKQPLPARRDALEKQLHESGHEHDRRQPIGQENHQVLQPAQGTARFGPLLLDLVEQGAA